MNKLLTVVVPSYNAEKYLRHNLDSLCLEELLGELEIIVVDDGSTDSTAQIADEYAEKFPGTVVPVHKENGGHGSGINTGIRYATGMYFKVIDADDWVDAEDLKNLICFIREKCRKHLCETPRSNNPEFVSEEITKKTDNNPDNDTDIARENDIAESLPDIIAGGYYWVYGQSEDAPKKEEFDKPFEGVEYGHIYSFNEIAEKAYIKMHSMTIRTDILKENDIRIDEHRYYVDTEYILYPIPYVKTVVFLNDHLYRYFISREGQSMSPQQMTKNKVQYDGVLQSLYEFYKNALTKKEMTDAKKTYIEHLIARVYASRIKILLWDRIAPATRRELMTMEQELKKNYPGIYHSNRNKAVAMLRASGYLLYYPAAMALRMKK